MAIGRQDCDVALILILAIDVLSVKKQNRLTHFAAAQPLKYHYLTTLYRGTITHHAPATPLPCYYNTKHISSAGKCSYEGGTLRRTACSVVVIASEFAKAGTSNLLSLPDVLSSFLHSS